MKNVKLVMLLMLSSLGLSSTSTQADVGADPGASQGASGGRGDMMRGFRHGGEGSCGGCNHGESGGKKGCSVSSEREADITIEADEWMKRATARETSARQHAGNTGARVDRGEVQRHSDSKNEPVFSGGFKDRR